MLSYERALASKYSHVRHTLIRRTLVHRTLVRRTLVRRTLVRGHDMLALPSLDGCRGGGWRRWPRRQQR